MRQAAARPGFTLIEILVVLALIGLIAGMAVLSAGASGDAAEREARRLSATLRLAVDESRLQGRVLGLRFDPRGYSYHELLPVESPNDPGLRLAWHPMPGKGALAPRAWPPRLEFALKINGRTVNTGGPQPSSLPQIVLLPEGEFTPFSLELRSAQVAGTALDFDASGSLELRRP